MMMEGERWCHFSVTEGALSALSRWLSAGEVKYFHVDKR